jgi:hypothetical protein
MIGFFIGTFNPQLEFAQGELRGPIKICPSSADAVLILHTAGKGG